MSTVHVVRQGEHLAGIAARHGFQSFRTIWERPENAALRALRGNPNILFPGDRVVIPTREPREETRPTDQRHRFRTQNETLRLRVKVLDASDRPVGGSASLIVGSSAIAMAKDGPVHDAPIDPLVGEAKLDFPISPQEKQRPTIALAVGSLDPIDTLYGQQKRLNNLGYLAGFEPIDAPTPQLVWAVEEFQCDHPPLVVDGKLGPQTRQKLKDVHGC